MVAVHNGDAFPASEDAVDPKRLLDARLVNGASTAPIGGFRIVGKATEGAVLVERAGTQYLALRTATRVLELPAARFENYLKGEGLDHVVAWRARNGESAKPGRERYSKYAKSVVMAGTPGDGWSQPLGLAIEFVPERDPATLRVGDSLPVRVVWRGKPAAGLQVECAWSAGGGRVAGRTDAQGRVRVLLDKAGKWRLHAVAIERVVDSAEVEWESYWASFTFEVR